MRTFARERKVKPDFRVFEGGDDIDTRAELLLDELAILPVGQNVDFNYWRGRFQTLFDEKLDDQTRQTLLMSYATRPDFVERSLVEQGQNPAQFQAARETD